MPRFKVPALILALALAFLAAGQAGAETPQDTRQRLNDQLRAVFERQHKLGRQLEEAQAQVRRIEQSLTEADRRVWDLGRRKEQIRAKRAELSTEAERLGRQIAGGEQSFRQRLRALYLFGPDASDWLLASSEGFHDALSRSQTFTRLLSAERARLDELNRRREELALVRSRLAFEENQLVETEQELDTQKKLLAELKDQKQDQAAQVTAKREELDGTVLALREALERLARTFDLPAYGQSAKSRAPTGGVLAAKGNLSPPVEGEVAAPYGPGQRGVILAARPGAPVRCPWWGRVVFAGPLAGYGLVVVVDHGQRVHTVLANLHSLAVSQGQQLAAGQPVGLVGGDGKLYVELRRSARPQNPLVWLRLSP